MQEKIEKEYRGIVVEESLIDNRMLNDIIVLVSKISSEEKPEERWHLNLVTVSEQEIEMLMSNLKDDHFLHFWKGKHIVVVFSDKRFEFKEHDEDSWKEAVEYGLSKGIPQPEMDFPIE